MAWKSTTTALVRKHSAEELIGHRDRAIELYRSGLEMIATAFAAHQLAAPGATFPAALSNRGYPLPSAMPEVTKEIDQDVWYHLIDATELKNIMGAAELSKLRDQIREAPPAVTLDTLRATMAQMYQDQDAIFRRGVVDVFRTLNRNYKNHDAFRLKRKIILPNSFRSREHPTDRGSAGSLSIHRRDQIRDLDRIFHILDGKPPKDHLGDASHLLNDAGWTGAERFETEYFGFEIYLNGNLHAVFRRPDLVTRANLIVARHYGDTIADEKRRRSDQ